jgi:HEAT repeat protein
MNSRSPFAMKSRTLHLFLSAALLAGPLAAADLSATFKAVAEYESGADVTSLRQVEQWVNESARSASLRRQLDTELAKLLVPGTSFEAKRFACQQLAVLGGSSAVQPLSELLTDTNTVGIACLALANIPSKKATEALIAGLAEARGMAKVQIIHTLGNRQEARAVQPLIAQSYAADQSIVNAAILALGKIGGTKAAKAIADLRGQNRPPCTAAVQEASLRIAEKLAAQGKRKPATALYSELLTADHPLGVRRGALIGLFSLDRDGGEGRMLDILRGSDAALKPVAISRVATLKSPMASMTFSHELSRLQPPEQVLLIEALAARGDAGALAVARDNLGATNASVRLAAIAALGTLGDAQTVPVLADALTSAKDAPERAAIELSLVKLRGGVETDRALGARIRGQTPEPKNVLISALSRRGSSEAVPTLLDATLNPDPAVAKAAFQGLARLAGPGDAAAVLLKLVQVESADVRQVAEDAGGQALGRIADAGQRSTLVLNGLQATRGVDARCSLIRLLPICGNAPALAVAQEARADADSRVADAGLRALADWPNSAAWDPLLAASQQTDNAAHRALAFRGLTRLASEDNARIDAKLVERYRTLLASAQSDDDRKLVLGALSGAASPDALPLALEQLTNPGVRAEAVSAVKKIAEAIKGTHPQAAQDALNKLK